MTRDNQRSRVYAAERDAFTWGQTIPNHELDHWLETKVLSRAWFRRRWGNRTIRVELGKGGGLAQGSTIRLGVGARNEWVFLHEVAHVLTPDKHGPQFAAVYVYLVGQVLGKEAAATLKAHFKAKGVKTKPSAVPAASTFNTAKLAPRAKANIVKPQKIARRDTLADVEREAKKIGAKVVIERRMDWRGRPLRGEWDLYVYPPAGRSWRMPGYETVEVLDDGAMYTSAYRDSWFTATDRCEEMVWAIRQGLAEAAA